MDGKLPTGRCHVRDVLVFGIVGHEPFEISQGNAAPVTENVYKLLTVLRNIKEARQRIEQQITLAH